MIHPEGKEKTVDSMASKKINFEVHSKMRQRTCANLSYFLDASYSECFFQEGLLFLKGEKSSFGLRKGVSH